MEKADITFGFVHQRGGKTNPTRLMGPSGPLLELTAGASSWYHKFGLPKGRPLHTEWPEIAKPNFACQTPGQLNMS